MSCFWACAVRYTRKLITRESKSDKPVASWLPPLQKNPYIQKIMTPIGFFRNIRRILFQKVFVETMCQLPQLASATEAIRGNPAVRSLLLTLAAVAVACLQVGNSTTSTVATKTVNAFGNMPKHMTSCYSTIVLIFIEQGSHLTKTERRRL